MLAVYTSIVVCWKLTSKDGSLHLIDSMSAEHRHAGSCMNKSCIILLIAIMICYLNDQLNVRRMPEARHCDVLAGGEPPG